MIPSIYPSHAEVWHTVKHKGVTGDSDHIDDVVHQEPILEPYWLAANGKAHVQGVGVGRIQPREDLTEITFKKELGQPGVEVLLPSIIFVGFEIVACIVPVSRSSGRMGRAAALFERFTLPCKSSRLVHSMVFSSSLSKLWKALRNVSNNKTNG